jgi:hypothetical protein
MLAGIPTRVEGLVCMVFSLKAKLRVGNVWGLKMELLFEELGFRVEGLKGLGLRV